VVLQNARDNLTVKQNNQKDQINVLRKDIADLSSQSEKTLPKSTLEDLEKYKNLVGLTEIRGQGIIITLNDGPSSPATENSIAHAADLRDIVNTLWGSGATAISINSERIVTNTSIDCIVNTVLINNTRTGTPFFIFALGNPQKLKSAIENRSNLPSLHNRIKDEGLIFKVETSKEIIVPAFNGSFKIEMAKIKG
jgi:uncharacterized protein YlxW (UPF0749 family)